MNASNKSEMIIKKIKMYICVGSTYIFGPIYKLDIFYDILVLC